MRILPRINQESAFRFPGRRARKGPPAGNDRPGVAFCTGARLRERFVTEFTSGPGAVRIGFAQTRPVFGQRAANLEAAARLVDAAVAFDVLVLPELFSTGYLFLSREEVDAAGEDTGGPTVTFLRDTARRRGAWLCGGFAERAGRALYNAAALAGPGGELHVYRKVHLFDRETEVFDPGDRPFHAIPVRAGGVDFRAGMMICFDWLFPEAARCLALDGADVLLHPSNLVLPFCQDAMSTRCLENRVFAVTANRSGEDVRGAERLAFTGSSQITGPRGDILVRAASAGECVEVVTIDPLRARDKRVTARNDLLGSRRPDVYGALAE